jgi:hypothetical protein
MFPRTPPAPPSPNPLGGAYKRIGVSKIQTSLIPSQKARNGVFECQKGCNHGEGRHGQRVGSAEKMRRYSIGNVSVSVCKRAKSVRCSSRAAFIVWK